MPSLQIQFFALPEETLSALERLEVVASCWKTLMVFSPGFILHTLPPGEPWVPSASGHDRVCLTVGPPRLPASSAYEFLALNPDALIIDLGRRTDSSLFESGLTARTDHPDLLKKWQRVVKEIKAETKAGLWAMSPETGKKAYYKIFRYSEGARSLAREGGRLRPVAGSSILSVDEPE